MSRKRTAPGRFVHGGWRNIPPAERGKLAGSARVTGWAEMASLELVQASRPLDELVHDPTLTESF